MSEDKGKNTESENTAGEGGGNKKPTPKSLTVRFMDAVLMAPWKIIDKYGDNPYRKGFGQEVANLVRTPRMTVAGLCLASAFALAAGGGVDNFLISTIPVPFLALAEINKRELRERADRRLDELAASSGGAFVHRYYFDTDPESISEIPEGTRAVIESQKMLAMRIVWFDFLISAMATSAGASVYMMSGDMGISVSLLALPLYGLIDRLSHVYYANRALKGNWAVITELPPKKKEEKVKSPVVGGELKPVRISSPAVPAPSSSL